MTGPHHASVALVSELRETLPSKKHSSVRLKKIDSVIQALLGRRGLKMARSAAASSKRKGPGFWSLFGQSKYQQNRNFFIVCVLSLAIAWGGQKLAAHFKLFEEYPYKDLEHWVVMHGGFVSEFAKRLAAGCSSGCL